MKEDKKITKEHIWLGCMAVGPIMAYSAVFHPCMIMIALIFLIIGIKGVLMDVM